MKDILDKCAKIWEAQRRKKISVLEEELSQKLGEEVKIYSIEDCDYVLKDDRIYCNKKERFVEQTCSSRVFEE